MKTEKKHKDCPTCTCNKPLWKTKEEIVAMRDDKQKREEIIDPLILDMGDDFVEIMS